MLVFGNEDIVRVEVDGGENWIEIKRLVSSSLSRRANRAAYGGAAKTITRKSESGEADSSYELSFNFGEFNRVMLEGMIVAWSYVYPAGHAKAGQAVPIKPDTIELIDIKTQDAILKEIDRYNKTMDDESKNSSSIN